jgi:hypothetical protein
MKENYPGEWLVESQPDEEDRIQGRYSPLEKQCNSSASSEADVLARRKYAQRRFREIKESLKNPSQKFY